MTTTKKDYLNPMRAFGRSRKQGTSLQESLNFNLALLSVFKLFLAFCFFLLLYLLVPTYTTFIRAPSYQNFHYFNISFYKHLTILCCLSFAGPYYYSSYTCSQPVTGCTALLLTALWVQPCHTTTFSSFSSVCLLSSSSLVGPLPCSSSTLPHINTNIHPSKQTPSCIHNFHCMFRALNNSSYFTHRYTTSLWGYPTQSRSHPPCKPPHLHPQHSLHAHP